LPTGDFKTKKELYSICKVGCRQGWAAAYAKIEFVFFSNGAEVAGKGKTIKAFCC